MATLALFGVTSLLAHGFASVNNIASILVQASFIGIVALGQFIVIVGGGIDLSVPNTLAGSAIVLSELANGDNHALVWAIPLVLAIAVIIGAANGLGVTVLGASPIVITLATNILILGLLLVLTHGGKAGASASFVTHLADGKVVGVPGAVIVWAILTIAVSAVMSRSVFGRRRYALGSNAIVAHFSGIRATPNTIGAYVASAVLAAIAGILFGGYTGEPYLGMGDSFLFTSISAVAIGGVAILGGSGVCAGTVAGALTITILQALLPIVHLGPAALNIVYGLVLLVTVALSAGRGEAED